MRWAAIVVMAACGGAERAPRVVAPVEVERPKLPPEPAPDLRQDTLDLAFAGDVMFGRFVKSGFAAIKAEDHDVFAEVAGILDSDFTMVNLETPVMRAPPTKSPYGTRMRFVATPERVARLVGANVDAVTCANNHAWDMHEEGLEETPQILDELGLRHVGTRRAEAPIVRVETVEAVGWRIGYVAVTAVANWGPNGGAGVPYVRPEQLEAAVVPVIEAGRDDHDLVIVVIHWGTEYVDTPSTWQIKAARAFVDAGAAAVIGHHPHVIQGIERYGDGVIAYSLGNFLFDNLHDTKRLHGVLHLEFRKAGTCLDGATYFPTVGSRPHYAPVPARKSNFRKVAGRMRKLSKAAPLERTEWELGKDRLTVSGACDGH